MNDLDKLLEGYDIPEKSNQVKKKAYMMLINIYPKLEGK